MRLSYIAKSIWHTLPVLFARLVLLLLSSAILHPINVFSSCRIFWTIVTDVWTIDIMRACEVLVVRLQRLAFPTKASFQAIDAILVVSAWHADLVAVAANPVCPLV